MLQQIVFANNGDTPPSSAQIDWTFSDGTDGETTGSTVVSINADDEAVITGGDSYSGDEGDIVGATLTATDAQGLTNGNVFSITTPAVNGVAVIDPASGVWTFTPADVNWFGSDSFSVTLTDDLGATTTQVVSITLAPEIGRAHV